MIGPKLLIRNKYFKIYSSIIDRARTRELKTYTEKHHIYPESFGGTKGKENIVRLTAREHFLCHWLLIKFTEGWAQERMERAITMMRMNRHGNRILSSWAYEVARKYSAIAQSKWMKENCPNRGKKNPEFGTRMSILLKGKKKSTNHRKRIKETWKESRPDVTCEFCGTITKGRGMYTRWHGDRCKLNPNHDPSVHDQFVVKMKAPKSQDTKKKLKEANSGKRWHFLRDQRKQFRPLEAPEGWTMGYGDF